MSLRLRLITGCGLFILSGFTFGAEIYARKMEIVKTPAGQVTIFRDSVALSQDGTFLTSRRAVMQEQAGWAVLTESVYIRTPEAQVWADSVVYDFKTRKATILAPVRNNVVVRQDSVVIRARAVEYFISERVLKAGQGLEISTEDGGYLLTGAHGFYNLDERTGVVDSAPLLTIKRGQEPVQVTARQMRYQESGAVARAEGQVRIQSGASSLACDTAIFYPNRDSGFAWGDPVLEDSAGRAAGDTVVFIVSNGALREVALLGRSNGRYRTEGGDTVLVQGKEISVLITDGKIERIEVAELSSGQLVRKAAAR